MNLNIPNHKIPIMISACLKPNYIERINGIKNTWMKSLDLDKYFPFFYCIDESILVDFFDEETKILHIAGIDDYARLSVKSVKCLEHIIKNTECTHIWKVDDDSYINCKLFNKYDTFLVYDYLGVPVYMKDAKNNYEDQVDEFGVKIKDKFGIDWFMSGAGYCLSREAAKTVIQHVPTYPIGPADDVLVSKAISTILYRVYEEFWEMINPFSGCNPTKELMIGHWVQNSEEMQTMHKYYE